MTEQEWTDLQQGFEIHLSMEKSLASLTIRNYLTDVRPLFDYIQSKELTGLKDLDRITLRGYLAWLVELGYVKSSVVRKLSGIRTFLRWALREGLIEKDPIPKRGVMKRERRLPRFLSQEDAAKLVGSPEKSEALGLRDRALLELIYAAGLRVSEARDLDIQDVNVRTREVRVIGKGSKQRVVLMGSAARDALTLYLSEERPELAGEKSGNALFLNRLGGRLSQRSMQKKVR